MLSIPVRKSDDGAELRTEQRLMGRIHGRGRRRPERVRLWSGSFRLEQARWACACGAKATTMVRVKCLSALQRPAGSRTCAFTRRPSFCRSVSIVDCSILKFANMGIETNVASMERQAFKPTCEQCGSLTVALPAETRPDPCSILKCGRCGSPRGTLQSLRDTSVLGGPALGLA
jgi:hypothetical protein